MKAFNLLHLYRYTRYLSDKFQICRTRTSIVKIITRTYISSGKFSQLYRNLESC